MEKPTYMHSSPPPKKIGDVLIKENLLTPEQLDLALKVQREMGGNKKLGDILIEMGFLTSGQMCYFLSQQMRARTSGSRKKLGEILVDAGIIREEQLAKALERRKQVDKKIGEILIEEGYVTRDQITDALSERLKVPIVSCEDVKLGVDLLGILPEDVLKKKQIFPVEKMKGTLLLAMADPLDYKTIDEVSFKTSLNVIPVLAYDWSITKAIEGNFTREKEEKEEENLFTAFDENISADKDIEFREVPTEEEENVNIDALYSKSKLPTVVKLVAMMVSEGSRQKASDIHIEPKERYVQVRFRVDSEMRDIFRYHKDIHASVVSRIKILSKLDITNRRVPQDGMMRISYQKRWIDLRVSTVQSIHGEKVVFRVLDQSRGIVPIEELGMPEGIRDSVKEIFKRPQGMLIVTGPTGSGKTTTLYSCLNVLRSVSKNVITIEDPAEYKLEGITQIQINEAVGRTFPVVLRSVLRQDPDVILLGEIRDLVTAEIAIKAALTGHLVLSTLHTNNTIATVTRLIDMGIPAYLLGSAINGLVAQRLIKRICVFCKTEATISQDQAALIATLGMPPIERHYVGRGCPKCSHSGYQGRIAVYEFLGITPGIRTALARSASEGELFSIARAEGSRFLFDDAWSKVKEGISTVDEVLAKVPIEHH